MNQHRVQSTTAGRGHRQTWAERVAGKATPLNRIMTATLIGFTGTTALAESPELLRDSSAWETVFTLRSSGGYKDNIFLAHANRQGSAYVTGGGDLMALRLAPEGPQWSCFANAEATHFLDPEHNEYAAFAQAKVEQDFSLNWKGSFAVESLYQDQFVDVAVLDTSLPVTSTMVQAAAIRSATLALRPGVEVFLSPDYSLTVEVPFERSYYSAPLDDYSQVGFKLGLTRTYGHASQASLIYEPAWRAYDSDPALTSAGTPIAGSQRERWQHETSLQWRHYWDTAKHWRTTAKAGRRFTLDNGGGYADYVQWFTAAQVRWRTAHWEIAFDGRLRQYDYQTQPVSSSDPTLRRRTEWSVGLNLERQLTSRLRLLAAYDHEHTLSNDSLENYAVNSFSGSVEWEF